MTKYERFVLWLNRFYHKQNKITICVLYTLIMAILGVLIYGATHQQANSSISVKYTVPTYTVTFDPNGGELSTIGGGGVSSKQVTLGDTYGDLPVPTRTGYVFLGWRGNNLIKASQLMDGRQSLTGGGVTFTLQNDNSIILNGTASETNWAYPFIFSFLDFVEVGETYFFYVNVDDVCTVFKILHEDGTYSYTIDKPYTVTGEEIDVEVYVEAYRGHIYNNVKVYPMLEKGQKTQYEPYYIESDTFFGAPGDRTLTAMWSSENILTGGALQTESDLAQWQQYMANSNKNVVTSGVASIVTEEGYSCTKINMAFNHISYIVQSIKGKYEIQRLYSVTAKVKLNNIIVGVYDEANKYYTLPRLMLYFSGKDTSGNWLYVMREQPLAEYNNKGWVNVRFVCITHPGDYSSVTANQVQSAEAHILLRNYTGDFYIRDFAIAKM